MTTTERPTLATIAVLVGVLAGGTILVLGAGSWAGTYTSNVRVAAVIVGASGVIAWLVASIARPEIRPASHLMAAFAASLAALAASAFGAVHPRYAIDFLGYAVILTGCYLLFVQIWRSAAIAQRLDVVLAAAVVGTGVAFIVAIVRQWIELWTVLGRVVMPPLRFGYEGLWTGTPNAIAAFQVLVLCGIGPALASRGRGGRLAVGAMTVLVAVDVVLSASRGAWLGIGLATLATVPVWLLIDRRPIATARRVLASRRAQALAAGIGATLVALGVAGVIVILPRLTDTTSSVSLRSSFLAASIRMFEAAPLTGLGPGSWSAQRPIYTTAADADYYIPHAHNIAAQTLAELGVVGAIAGVVAIAALVRLLVMGLRHDDRRRWFALAALFACVYFVGQQMVDEWVHQPAILFAFAVPIARLDSAMLVPPRTTVAGWRGRMLAIVMIVAVVVAIGAALWPERAAVANERAVTAADAGRWADALGEASAAVSLDPSLPPYQFTKGLAAAHAGDLEAARIAFQAATADDLPQAWLNLAAVQARLGDANAAKSSLSRALRIGRQQPAVLLAAAGLYRDLGDEASARGSLAQAVAAVPSLIADPLWDQPEWRPIADGATTDALSLASGWQEMLVALEANRLDDARRQAADRTGPERSLADVVVRAWSGDAEAFGQLHAAAVANPMDEQTVAMCRRVAELRARADGDPSWTCDGRFWFGVYPVAHVQPGPTAAAVPGPAPYPHGLYAYRRPGPIDLLVPWLLHLSTSIA